MSTCHDSGYWAGYVKRLRDDSANASPLQSGGGASSPAACTGAGGAGKLEAARHGGAAKQHHHIHVPDGKARPEWVSTFAQAARPLSPDSPSGLGPSPSQQGPPSLHSAKSAPPAKEVSRESLVGARPDWDPSFAYPSSFRGRSSVSPRASTGALDSKHRCRSAALGPRPGTSDALHSALARAGVRGATQAAGAAQLRERRYSSAGSCGSGAAKQQQQQQRANSATAAVAAAAKQLRAKQPAPVGVGPASQQVEQPQRAASSPPPQPHIPPALNDAQPAPTPDGPHRAQAPQAEATAPGGGGAGVDVLFAACCSELDRLEDGALRLLMLARRAMEHEAQPSDQDKQPHEQQQQQSPSSPQQQRQRRRPSKGGAWADGGGEGATSTWGALKRQAAQRWQASLRRPGQANGEGSGGGMLRQRYTSSSGGAVAE
ncbi:hypothetical protein MNEG_4280 [Monoraphidium neglectum]|uniref:Uncharacterized protein n=1 Tax=Monoraphidium neglectum TaxID=145388 RepID=A0A0D2MLD8_9CHLO|nr:hypothetical protein MNEG_4280 [Monoraphidium neglectum]KIZ03675.1 hypothetical protein MNEG_4280 [Monoraphidium neglectum]|eukprot:XP_013902694.1 hypothetical protein MNEG_4280 [Monoraphidium neglectum]